MQKRTLRHRVERTRNKHSRAVFHNGTIIIRLARGLTKGEEREHISDLLKRMRRHAIEELRKTAIDPFGRLLSSGERTTITLASGRKHTIALKPGATTRIERHQRGWTVTVGPRLRKAGLHRLLWKTLSGYERYRVEKFIRDINEDTFGVAIRDVKLRFASSQWGSCSPRGAIMINTALLFVPPQIFRYVVIHELAHRKRADHSPQYWRWVEWAMPGYRRARDELGEYRLTAL